MWSRPHSLLIVGRRFPLFLASSLVACLMLGCVKPMPPEHVAAISKMQGLGGKVLFENGGYRLNMADSRVTNDDLAHLANVENLKTLDLRNTQVSDEGIKKLVPLKSLNLVILAGSQVTAEGIEALKAARPDIKISR